MFVTDGNIEFITYDSLKCSQLTVDNNEFAIRFHTNYSYSKGLSLLR